MSGKMLNASSSRMVGPTKNHASARSERPRRGGPTPALSSPRVMASMGTKAITRRSRLDLSVFLEDLGPVLEQSVERFLRRSLAGNHVVVRALLHRQQQLRVAGLAPEVLDDLHRVEKDRRVRRGLLEARRLEDR